MKRIANHRCSVFLSSILLLGMLVAGCAPVPSQSRSVVFPLATEPPTLNPYLANSGWETLVSLLINESLTGVNPQGEYYPILAAEIPTRDNDGVSQDGLTITWKLKKGVVWSDGVPFTSQDVVFTWKAAKDPEGGAVWNPGVGQIANVEALDDYTVIITYSEFYPDYLGQFSSTNSGGQGIFPKHACGEPRDMMNWTCNRAPVGTGPFMLEEWRSGEYMSLVRNPRFREAGKPSLDKIIFPIVPDSANHYQMLIKGDADVWWFFDQHYTEDLLKSDKVMLSQGSQQYSLRLFLNLNEPKTNDANTPHHVLGDLRVREAIRLALDAEQIKTSVYRGLGQIVQHEVFLGKYVCSAPQISRDLPKAQQLLDEAGFKDIDGDGIRECYSCKHGTEGEKAILTLITSDDEPPLATTQQLIADQLLAVGIKVSPKLDANFEELALAGDFDIMMWPDGADPVSDPAYLMGTYYRSSAIPEYNIMRYRNTRVDAIFDALEKQPDYRSRQRLICEIDALVTNDVPVIFLMAVPYPSAFGSRVQNWEDNPNAVLTWDAANWSVK